MRGEGIGDLTWNWQHGGWLQGRKTFRKNPFATAVSPKKARSANFKHKEDEEGRGASPPSKNLGYKVVNDLTVHVGEAVLATLKLEGESFVIETQ